MLHFSVLSRPERLAALEPEWDRLHARSKERRYSASHCWCWASWEVVHQPQGHQLCVLVGREDEALVLIWPFIITSRRRLRHATPLGTAFGEYSLGLVLESPSSLRLVQAAWRYLHRHRIVDLVSFPAVRRDSDLYSVLGDSFGPIITATATSYSVRCSEPVDRSNLQQRMSAHFRRQLRKGWRELNELGEIRLEVAAGGGPGEAVIDWILDHKRRQLARKGQRAPWLDFPPYRDLLVRDAKRSCPSGSLMTFALCCDDEIVAAMMMRRDARRLEMLNTVFDVRFQRFQPGHLLMQEVLGWASDQHLDADLRMGDYPYKRQLCSETCSVTSWTAPVSLCGWIWLLHRRLRCWGRRVLSRHVD